MTLPVSTSGRDLPGRLLAERGGGSVQGGVVGDAVEPAAVDHPDPGAGQDAHGVRRYQYAAPGCEYGKFE